MTERALFMLETKATEETFADQIPVIVATTVTFDVLSELTLTGTTMA